MMDELAQLVRTHREDVEFRHILEFQQEGIPDEVWIPERAREGWIVITADRGRGGGGGRGRTNKLPSLCKQQGITHIAMTATIHAMKQFDKVRIILELWHDIIREVADAPRGSAFIIRMGTRHPRIEKR